MQLNITTDYAVRVILMLSAPNSFASAAEIAQTLVIPPNYLMKILTKLKAAGLIASTRGVNGGYCLEKPAKEISFQMIFEAMGDTVKINRCLEPDGYCSRNATATCPVHSFYLKIQNDLENYFAHTTLADLVGEEARRDD
ncbi:conserved exported hypothetical protein [uncultured Eubacteriales bacterium]|uniref:Rrf2 family transcriptional regulator n=1 Tax=uncultured Eubacteriales bacterium TaxID=172733 RepID=A0A212IXG7_9FIRM|nr:conserved exported hypothetical protein [uncultured Eubacteriales bacterium]